MGESEERGGSQGGFNVGESEERGGQKPMSKSKFLCTGGWVHAALPLSVDGTPSLARCRDKDDGSPKRVLKELEVIRACLYKS